MSEKEKLYTVTVRREVYFMINVQVNASEPDEAHDLAMAKTANIDHTSGEWDQTGDSDDVVAIYDNFGTNVQEAKINGNH